MSIKKAERLLAGKEMAMRGYRTANIQTQTMLTQSQVRALMTELRDQGVDVNNRNGPAPSPAYIIRTRRAAAEGSLIVAIYLDMASQSANTQPYRSIDTKILDAAYDAYLDYRKSMTFLQKERPLTIDQAYKLIVSLRDRDIDYSQAAFVGKCENCRSIYLYTLKQTTTDCPICKLKDTGSSAGKNDPEQESLL